MAVKTRYRIRKDDGEYEIVHLETSADLIITNDELQFVNAKEKEKINSLTNPSYIHNQISSDCKWEIRHSLNKYPSVSIVDSAGSIVFGDVEYVDQNFIIIYFTSAFSGKAYLN